MATSSVRVRCWHPGTAGKCRLAVGALLGAAALLIAGCGGSSGASGTTSKAAYCVAFQKAWAALDAASQKESDAFQSLQGSLPDDVSTVRRQLVADRGTYQSAAALASSLAKSAPTKLKNDVTADTENPKKSLLHLSAALASVAKGDTKALDDGFTDQFDAGSTGCNFATEGGPNGTVAAEFWP